jgi:hypothetical protein
VGWVDVPQKDGEVKAILTPPGPPRTSYMGPVFGTYPRRVPSYLVDPRPGSAVMVWMVWAWRLERRVVASGSLIKGGPTSLEEVPKSRQQQGLRFGQNTTRQRCLCTY